MVNYRCSVEVTLALQTCFEQNTASLITNVLNIFTRFIKAKKVIFGTEGLQPVLHIQQRSKVNQRSNWGHVIFLLYKLVERSKVIKLYVILEHFTQALI